MDKPTQLNIVVEDVLNWRQMAGQTDLEKKLNSYLTYSLVGRYNIPHDSCLTYAKYIANMTVSTNREPIVDLIEKWFGDKNVVSLHEKNVLANIAEGAAAILMIERLGQ